jgi:hypothetical protein
MEPLRPTVDRIILDFARANPFNPADFTIRRDGACRLNPELAKILVGLVERQAPRIDILIQRNFLPTRLPELGRERLALLKAY